MEVAGKALYMNPLPSAAFKRTPFRIIYDMW
jgi:hypothetical protein